jgi:hypothetical protein
MSTSTHTTGNPSRGASIAVSVARKTPPRAQGEAMLLEQRIVFDAALLVTAVEGTPEAPHPVPEDVQPPEAQTADAPAPDAQAEEAPPHDDGPAGSDDGTMVPGPVGTSATDDVDETVAEAEAVDPVQNDNTPEVSAEPANQATVVFVDADAVDLLETVDVSTSEVVVLDAGTNGVEQMANHLQGRTGIDTIHVLSHGSTGQLELGSGLLNLSTLQGDYADELVTIRAALSPDADLLIYGCDVASTEEGEAFVAALAQATGADVAASTDDTGALALGGDWELEHQVGRLEASALSADGWNGLLATTVPSQSLDFSDIATLNGVEFTGSATVVAGDVVRLVGVLTIQGQSVDLLLTVLSIDNVNGNTTISDVGRVEILASPNLDPRAVRHQRRGQPGRHRHDRGGRLAVGRVQWGGRRERSGVRRFHQLGGPCGIRLLPHGPGRGGGPR